MDTGMGEHQGDGGPPGRRHAHPPGAGSGPGEVRGAGGDSWTGGGARDGDASVEAVLVAALRGGAVDAAGEQRAVEAFRAARDGGALRAARTRRRDDWRPRRRPRARRSVNATLALLLAGLTLGGVAVAAIGSAGSPDAGPGGGRPTGPSSGSSAAPRDVRPPGGSHPPGGPTTPGGATPDRPATARDTVAHCRAYEQIEHNGKALDATAWQRLVTAAGGKEYVAAYCARRLAARQPEAQPSQARQPTSQRSEAQPTPGGNGRGGAGSGGGTRSATDGGKEQGSDGRAGDVGGSGRGGGGAGGGSQG